ncbi:AAA family ATPase [Nitratifractor salsuginis]|uniref:ATPase associated with various cellular activities AAA_3 n=1 Tax=Nitratifractor salsuginis (strain DSM 16511 / JCM 12458 / E9I37-1) TaxID=749222 RepID=E6X2M5_NITSE|nr:MoxR family ATPase [Nitratifractor salsuginis]ADV46091.1 ATPase associated with various cellular activities AAA_3 [Nitratifractor salsuginis DSM 16511]
MIEKLKREIHKVVIGHEELIESMIVALFSGGHILVEGVPGVAKTTAVKALADSLGFSFKRVQFTPDLLPGDIIGNEILDLKSNDFRVKHGPIFTHLLLADEINRAGPKVQSALLEAMAERQVTIGEESFALPEPFMVLATANPVEQEGTYELPEAALDRFMMKVKVGYNDFDEELRIMERAADGSFGPVEQVLDPEAFTRLKDEPKSVHVDEEIKCYMLTLIQATRDPGAFGLEDLAPYIDFGASPRGSIDLYKASRARAWLRGRDYVTPSDVAAMAYPVLRHRILLSYAAASVPLESDDVIRKILETIPAP